MIANERATLSRKLKESAYKNRENAVMAIPAVRIWLSVWIPARSGADQPLIIQTLPVNDSQQHLKNAAGFYFNTFAKKMATS